MKIFKDKKIWESSEKVFLSYLYTSIRARPFQLYDEIGKILFARPEIEHSNIYFIVENTKIRFIPEKTTVDKNGVIKIFFRIANKRSMRRKVTFPQLFLDKATLEKGFKSVIIGVKDQENFEKEMFRRKTSFLSGLSFNLTKSNDNILIFNVYTKDWTRELPMIAHNLIDLLKISIADKSRILYIGQSNQIKKRIAVHEKIQRALSEVADDKDIYIYFFTFVAKHFYMNAPKRFAEFIENPETGYIHDQGLLNLVEMGLINYFKPRYNSTFVDTEISSNQQVEKLLRDNGFTQMVIDVDFDDKIWHFSSDCIPSKESHSIIYKIE
ncbi:MAG: hypothetical protein KDJ65_05380 [Anaerolineae bacterium]|nr:hypothetical protein [Anaerolineae bacterium]